MSVHANALVAVEIDAFYSAYGVTENTPPLETLNLAYEVNLHQHPWTKRKPDIY